MAKTTTPRRFSGLRVCSHSASVMSLINRFNVCILKAPFTLSDTKEKQFTHGAIANADAQCELTLNTNSPLYYGPFTLAILSEIVICKLTLIFVTNECKGLFIPSKSGSESEKD